MLPEHADALFNQLIKAFPADRDFARADFSRPGMPPLVAHFLSQMIQSRLDLEVERMRGGRSPWFAFNHPDVQAAYGAVSVALSQHVHVPQPDWARLLHEAVHRVASYVVHPVPTLIDFIFDEEDLTLPGRQIFRGLAFFGAYPYLREVVTGYFKQKNLQEIDRERLTSILRHSEREITRGYSVDDWTRLLTPLFNLFGAAPGGDAGIPAPLVDAFLEEKDAERLQNLVRARMAGDEGARLTLDELRRMMDEDSGAIVYKTPDPAADAAPEEDEEPEEEKGPQVQVPPAKEAHHSATEVVSRNGRAPAQQPVQQADGPPPEVRDEVKAPVSRALAGEKPAAVPLWQQYRRPDEPTKAAAAARPKPEAAPQERRSPLWMQFRKPKDDAATHAASAPDAERSVLGEAGPANRVRFIEALFGGSEEAYSAVLRKLEPVADWSQASRIIAEDVFRQHGVDIYSEAAVAFTDAVERRFRRP